MAAQWNDSQPIYWQLKERTIAMILDGTLAEGEALHAPIKRVSGYDTIMPLYKREQDYLPGTRRILNAVEEIMEVS